MVHRFEQINEPLSEHERKPAILGESVTPPRVAVHAFARALNTRDG